MNKLKTIIRQFEKKDYWGYDFIVKERILIFEKLSSQQKERYRSMDITELNYKNRIKTLTIRHNRKTVFKNIINPIYNAIKNNDIGYLVKKLTYNNKFSIKIFEVLTGLKLPKTNKDIEKFLNEVKLNMGGLI